jgi:hypothetical protein
MSVPGLVSVQYIAVQGRVSWRGSASMPTTITELVDGTAFERLVLDRAFPLMPPAGRAASVVDLGTSSSISVAVTPQPAVASVSVSLSDSSGSPAGQLSVDTVRPLIFGAAWKVLDQIAELALEQTGVSHGRGSDYTIKLKTQTAAVGGVRALPPLDRYTAVWGRIMLPFAATAEIRNSLAHRQLAVDPSSGAYQRHAAAGSAVGHAGHGGRAGRVLPTCHRHRKRRHSRDHPEPSARPAALESRSTRRSPWPASVWRLIGDRVDSTCHRPPNGLQGRGPGARLCHHPSGCRYGCGRCLPLRPGDTPARRQDSRVRARRCAGHDPR